MSIVADIALAIILLCIFILQLLIYFDAKKSSSDATPTKEEEDKPESLSVRESVYLREREYDERINRMKLELAMQNTAQRADTVADESDGVHNLPHDIIREAQYDYLPDVEESD